MKSKGKMITTLSIGVFSLALRITYCAMSIYALDDPDTSNSLHFKDNSLQCDDNYDYELAMDFYIILSEYLPMFFFLFSLFISHMNYKRNQNDMNFPPAEDYNPDPNGFLHPAYKTCDKRYSHISNVEADYLYRRMSNARSQLQSDHIKSPSSREFGHSTNNQNVGVSSDLSYLQGKENNILYSPVSYNHLRKYQGLPGNSNEETKSQRTS
mmetsp:Transcript_18235/g.17356  ORF Transcript_18235/g.17356 Transcript_18235/m.17356 type:complete len:211 (+) Transcript_18235:685-1317(+)